jgi:hypothetical protein
VKKRNRWRVGFATAGAYTWSSPVAYRRKKSQ